MFKETKNIEIKNKRAEFDYEVLDTYTAGLVLYGTEIKSIRAGHAGLSDTYCIFLSGELWVKNMHIAAYRMGSFNNHELRRDRKLLLTKRELRKLQRGTLETGNTIVPLRLFINEQGLAKLDVALCRGKKQYDKRETLKRKDDRREMDRVLKNNQ